MRPTKIQRFKRGLKGMKDMSINKATPAEWDKATKASLRNEVLAKREEYLDNEEAILPDHYDPVNPHHYKSEGVECIDYIKQQLSRDAYVGYLEGNVIKYMHRHKYKGGLEDLRKAQWYLEKLAQATIEGGNR